MLNYKEGHPNPHQYTTHVCPNGRERGQHIDIYKYSKCLLILRTSYTGQQSIRPNLTRFRALWPTPLVGSARICSEIVSQNV